MDSSFWNRCTASLSAVAHNVHVGIWIITWSWQINLGMNIKGNMVCLNYYQQFYIFNPYWLHVRSGLNEAGMADICQR